MNSQAGALERDTAVVSARVDRSSPSPLAGHRLRRRPLGFLVVTSAAVAMACALIAFACRGGIARQVMQAKARQAQGALETLQLRSQLARKALARDEGLATNAFVAAAQVLQRQKELLGLQLRESNSERNLRSLRRDLQSGRTDKLAGDTQARTTLIQLDRPLAPLDRKATENEICSSLLVTAPSPGRISVLPVNSGQALQAGQAVANLMPRVGTGAPAELQRQLFAPSPTAGFVQPGQDVFPRHEGYSFDQSGSSQGRGLAVSKSPISPNDPLLGQSQALVAATRANESGHRINAQLPNQVANTFGTPIHLHASMILHAGIRRDYRKS